MFYERDQRQDVEGYYRQLPGFVVVELGQKSVQYLLQPHHIHQTEEHPKNKPLQDLVQTMSPQIHPTHRHQHHQHHTNPNILVSDPNPPILLQNPEAQYHREPAMTTRIAILHRTVKPNILHTITRPYRPRITMISFDQCSKECIHKYKT